MPILANERHELFAQELAKGLSADAAYVAAGYKQNYGNCIAAKNRPDVQARVKEILGAAAERAIVTIHDIADQLDEDRHFARLHEAPGPAITATMGKAKVLGLLTEKVEHTGKDGGAIEIAEMSDTEKARRIAFALTRGTQQPTAH